MSPSHYCDVTSASQTNQVAWTATFQPPVALQASHWKQLTTACFYSDPVYHLALVRSCSGKNPGPLFAFFQSCSSTSLVLHLLDIWPFTASLISSQNFSLESDDRFAFSGKALEHAHSVWQSSRLHNPTLWLVNISCFPDGLVWTLLCGWES